MLYESLSLVRVFMRRERRLYNLYVMRTLRSTDFEVGLFYTSCVHAVEWAR